MHALLANADFQNDPFLYVIAGIVVAFVLFMAFWFLIKAIREGKRLGLSTKKLKDAALSAAVFTIAPSIAVLLTVVTLAGSLGIPLPWVRLSVIGAITYEVPAAQAVADAMGGTLSSAASTPEGFTAIAWVMTLGIMLSVILIILFNKKIQGGMKILKSRDPKWMSILMSALFLGLISAFLSSALSGETTDRTQPNVTIPATTGSILVSVLTLITSAVVMAICGLLMKKFKWKWLENYAIPISMLFSMGMAIVYNMVLPAALFVAA